MNYEANPELGFGPGRETPPKLAPHSKDLAWLLGFLAASGTITKDIIRFQHPNGLVRDYLAGRIANILGIESWEQHFNSDKVGDRSPRIASKLPQAADLLGDLTDKCWPQTIHEKHAWVENNAEFAWSFLIGYFENRGTISDPLLTHDHLVSLHTATADKRF